MTRRQTIRYRHIGSATQAGHHGRQRLVRRGVRVAALERPVAVGLADRQARPVEIPHDGEQALCAAELGLGAGARGAAGCVACGLCGEGVAAPALVAVLGAAVLEAAFAAGGGAEGGGVGGVGVGFDGECWARGVVLEAAEG